MWNHIGTTCIVRLCGVFVTRDDLFSSVNITRVNIFIEFICQGTLPRKDNTKNNNNNVIAGDAIVDGAVKFYIGLHHSVDVPEFHSTHIDKWGTKYKFADFVIDINRKWQQ